LQFEKKMKIMKKYLIFTLTAIALCACTGTTTREFRTLDNKLVASCTYEGSDSLHAQWQFTDPEVKDCDSLRVVEMGPAGHPMTVCFYMGEKELWRQYYSDMQLRSEGVTVGGLREGRWVFYYAGGLPQTEANFVGGKEEGPYKVYRENGIPYYIGQYHEGQRTGTWEIYASDGTLETTQNF
jgi:hypothetical protein